VVRGSGAEENWSIEFRNSGLEESYQLGVPFFCFFSSLLFSSYFITSLDLGAVQMASARVLPPPDPSQREVEFPRAPDPPKGYCTVPIGSGTFKFVRVRTRHDCLMLSFPFLSLVQYMQPRRSAPREGDTVTAARNPGPGNGHSI